MGNTNTVYRARGASLSNPTSATTFLDSSDSTKAAVVYFPQCSVTTAFRFRAMGRATTVGSHNVTPKVSFGSSITAASNTVMAAATARACATTTASWIIWGEVVWNVTSSKLEGWFSAVNGSTAVLDAAAVLTSAISSVNLATPSSSNALSVEITVATGGGDTAYLDELTLEVL